MAASGITPEQNDQLRRLVSKELLPRFEGKRAALARALEIDPSSVSGWFTKQTGFRRDVAQRVVELAGYGSLEEFFILKSRSDHPPAVRNQDLARALNEARTRWPTIPPWAWTAAIDLMMLRRLRTVSPEAVHDFATLALRYLDEASITPSTGLVGLIRPVGDA